MKKKLSILIIMMTCISWRNADRQLLKKNNHLTKLQPGSDPLTVEDRRNYILTIDQNEILSPVGYGSKDFPSNQLNLAIALTLSNNSNDTLKYLVNDISWSDIYKTDNAYLHISKNYVGVNPNPVKVEFVAPHKSLTFALHINYNKTKVSSGSPFRVCMGIFKFKNKQQLSAFNPGKNFNVTDTTHLVWSNTVIIPK